MLNTGLLTLNIYITHALSLGCLLFALVTWVADNFAIVADKVTITYDLLLESNKYNIILTAEKYLINFAKLNDLDLKGSYNPHKYEFSNEDFFDGVHGRDRVFKKIFQPVLWRAVMKHMWVSY